MAHRWTIERLIAFAPVMAGLHPVAAWAQDQAAPAAPAATAPSADATAQDGAAAATSGQVEDIVVTARKTNESLQVTPIAITAASAEDLQAKSVRDISDLAKVSPSLHAAAGAFGGGGSSTAFFIRGIGQIDVLPTSDPGVGVYVDGVYLARSTGNLFDLANISQVEVLRGPQGTLFGKNTSGGAISVTTRRPTGDLAGRVEGTLGSFWRHDLKGTVEFPISDTVAGSVTLVTRNDDGYGRRIGGGRIGETSLLGARGALNVHGGGNFTYFVSADYTRRRETPSPSALIAKYPTAPTSALSRWNTLVYGPSHSGNIYDGRYVTADGLNPYVGTDLRSDTDVGGISGIGALETGIGTVKSITAFRAQRVVANVDNDASPLPVAQNNRTVREQQITQEFQLVGSAIDSQLKYAAGLFYLHEYATIATDQDYLPGLYSAMVAARIANPIDQGINARARQFDDSYAAYLNLNFALNDWLSVTGGIRYSIETKNLSEVADFKEKGTSIFNTATTPATPLPLGSQIAAERTWRSATPTAGIQAKLSRQAFVYASYAQGFKSGGFDGRPISGIATPASFNPEHVDTFEVGTKLDLFDRHARLNVAAFHTDYKDLQVQVIQTVNGITVNQQTNAGSARLQGIEVEGTLLPLAGLRLEGQGSFLDSKFTSLNAGTPFPLTDHLQQAPRWTLNGAVQYARSVGRAGTLTGRVDYNWTSTIYNELPNTYGYNATGTAIVANGPLVYPTRQGPVGLLGARLTLELPDKAWSVALFGTNLTDKTYKTFGFSSTSFGTSVAYFGRPREFGITLARNF